MGKWEWGVWMYGIQESSRDIKCVIKKKKKAGGGIMEETAYKLWN